jgi:hypothetical protein
LDFFFPVGLHLVGGVPDLARLSHGIQLFLWWSMRRTVRAKINQLWGECVESGDSEREGGGEAER